MALIKTVHMITNCDYSQGIKIHSWHLLAVLWIIPTNTKWEWSRNGATMKCKIKHHIDSHPRHSFTVRALSTIFYTPSMPKITQRQNYVLLVSPYCMFLGPAGHSGKEASKLLYPQCLSLVPQSQLLLCWHTLPVIKDVMQVLALGKLHLFSKGISGRHITCLFPLAFPVGAKALPDPQWALWRVLWAGGVARVTGMMACWRKLGVRCRIPAWARQGL